MADPRATPGVMLAVAIDAPADPPAVVARVDAGEAAYRRVILASLGSPWTPPDPADCRAAYERVMARVGRAPSHSTGGGMGH